MKKFSLLIVCIVMALSAGYAQKAVINFEEKSHDFGRINEESGKVTYIFEFTNKGMTPLVVNRVQASCGCTTPDWTKEPIEPGKKGNVTVTYNPSGRPGPFTKTITVYSNAAEEQAVLIIKGEVIPKQTSENPTYPVNMGGLMLKAKVVQMNNVNKGDKQVRTLDIQNSSKSPIKLSIDNQPYLTVTVSPEILKPNEEGKITFTFNSTKYNQWGTISDEVYVIVNGQKKYTEEFKLNIVGNVFEDFSKLTLDQKRKSPILEMPAKSLNFGNIKVNSKRDIKFKISNKGQNALEIRRIYNNNNEFVVRASKTTIASGKSSEIIATLNTKNLSEGDYKKSFTIQTNDPDNSFLILVLSWTIQK